MSRISASTIGSENRAENVVERAAHGAHAMVDRVAEKAGPAVDRLCSNVDTAAEKFKSGVDCVGEAQARWVEGGRECVRHHPLVSVGIAIVAGALLVRLFGRY